MKYVATRPGMSVAMEEKNKNYSTLYLFAQNLHAGHLKHYFVTHHRRAVTVSVFLGFFQHRSFVQCLRHLHNGAEHSVLDGGLGVIEMDEQLIQCVVDGGGGEALGVGAALKEHHQSSADRHAHLVVAVVQTRHCQEPE